MVWFFFLRDGGYGKSINPLAARLVQLLTPASATASDWKRAKVLKSTLGDTAISYWSLTNMRPIMEADTNTTAFHVRATNRRDADGKIVTTVWSNKNANTLEVDWSSGTVNRQDRRTDNGPKFNEMHRDQHGAQNSGLGFSGRPLEPIIVANFWKDGKEICEALPFDYTKYFPVNGFISNNYPIAAMPLIPNDGLGAPAILLLDAHGKRLLGEVKLPAEAKGGRPNFILDQENDVLLAAQFGLDWLVAIDLRLYIGQKKDAPIVDQAK